MLQVHSVGRGYTIVELMTVVSIIALLATAAIPSFQSFVKNSQATTLATKLANSFRIAKNEAIKRGKSVHVCPISNFSSDGTFSTSSEDYPCVSTANWNSWKVFEDPNADGTESYSNGWPVIKYYGKDANGAIVANANGGIIFDALGFANLSPNVADDIWDGDTGDSNINWQWDSAEAANNSVSYLRTFRIVPAGCTGNNARIVTIQSSGVIKVDRADCYGF